MNDDRWTQIERLVEQALALPPEDRAAFIDQECGDDEALRNEIQSLLEHGDKALSFMGHFEEDVVAPSIDNMAQSKFDEDHRIDALFGHYHITDILGRGGMGIVYKARDTKLDRTVAVKFLPSHLTRSDKDRQRFIREAKAAAALNHPNICGIHAIEEYEGQTFISMEYIDGQTLRERLESEEITPKTALTFAIQIAEALAEAHEKGIVHRDIKPGNIMVDAKDRIKVMDFGLAKLVDSTPITQTGTTLGTMAYMAPEQIQGRPVDHRADLFSFGVLLFEMLAGERPFGGQYDAALSYAIVNENPPLLSDFLPDAPQKLSLLIKRLLEKDPAKRFSDTKKLANELKTCLDHLPDSMELIESVTTHKNHSGGFFGSESTNITFSLPALRTQNGILSLAGILIILSLIGYWLLPDSNSEATPTNNKIAVLPLESISTEPEDIQFTDGVHEELINRLAGISELTVIGRSSVLGFEPGQRDMESIGQQLGVSSLMEGTVRRIGDQLRVSIQLIDATSLATLWSGSFDDNIDDVFEIQSRIARQVAGELQASLTADEQKQLNVRPTDNPQAFLYYMQGRAFLSRGVFDEENLYMAEQLLRNAVELDPEFAQAWGILAYAYSQLYWFTQDNQENLKNLERAAEWALFYGPDHAETYLANGVYLFWTSKDNRQTLSHFESAIKKYPNDSLILFMTAYTHRSLGNWKELFDYLKRALELDPLNINIHTELAYDYLLIRNYEKAEEYVKRFRELAENPFYFVVFSIRSGLAKNGTLEVYEDLWNQISPSDPAVEEPLHFGHYNRFKRNWDEALRSYKNSKDINAQYFIGTVLERLGDHNEAQTYYEAAKNDWEQLLEEYPNNPFYRSALGKVYTRLGNIDKAIQEGERALEISSTQIHLVGTWIEFDLAEIYAWSGNKELAIDLLEYCLTVPSEEAHRNIIRLDPIWDPLRDNPRFQELIAGEDEPFIEGL